MKAVLVHLPDVVFSRANDEAEALGIEVAGYCAGVLSDQLLRPKTPTRTSRSDSNRPDVVPTASEGFVVAREFPNFPRGSILLAQACVDQALRLPDVRAFKKHRGIGFDPNFVFIEYLTSKGGRVGISVSFYGQPERHLNPPSILVKGIPSYSRAKVETEADLAAIVPHIRQAYELKFGPIDA